MSRKKRVYRPRSWSEYNKSLVCRGSLTLWVNETVIADWYARDKTGKKGASRRYADLAILCANQVRFLYHLPLRATQGFLISLFALLKIECVVPCYTTLCRRLKELDLPLIHTPSKEPRHLVLDSTGLKVYGEGEWKVRTHGWSKRRTWRKMHLGVDSATQEIVCGLLTTNDFKDSEVFEACLTQLEEPLERVSADGAYDAKNCYDYCEANNIQPLIPPRKDAKIKKHGNSAGPPQARDAAIREIRKHGSRYWRLHSGYSYRALAETVMFRFKKIFSEHLFSRNFKIQAQEVFIKCNILNAFSCIGLPKSMAI